MKRLMILAAVSLFFGFTAYGQRVQSEVVQIDKQDVPGFTMTFTDYSPDQIATAMSNRLTKKSGLKSSSFKGFTAYLSQNFPEIGTAHYDIYTKTAYVGKKKENITKLYFIVTKGNMNAIESSSEPDAMNNTIAFLNSFIEFARVDCIENSILDLNKQLTKEQKNHDKIVKQQEKLKEKANEMQSDLEKSQENINKLKTDIANGNASINK